MFKHLNSFSRIVVTGPQLSGTTIEAKAIDSDLGYQYVDEDDIGVKSLSSLFGALRFDRVVIQSPATCSCVHWIDTPSTAVVMMRRSVMEIVASQQRIGWDDQIAERKNYFKIDGEIASIKYWAWEEFQRDSMRVPFFEVNYSDLSRHRIWVASEHRRNFKPRQTERANEDQ